jgi:hypothetical protein
MHRYRVTLAVILVAAGLVWIGQGTGLLQGGSFMVGDMRWALVGTVCVVAGGVVAATEVRRRRA